MKQDLLATQQRCKDCKKVMGINAVGLCRECNIKKCKICQGPFKLTIKSLAETLCMKCRVKKKNKAYFEDY